MSRAAFGLAAQPPPYRILKERRATFRATPAQLKRRPAMATRWTNLLLARRLCRYRLAGNDRRRYSLRSCRGRGDHPASRRRCPRRASGSDSTERSDAPIRCDEPRPQSCPARPGGGAGDDWLLSRQHDDGHWVFELEADATIPAEYILLQHYLDTIDADLEQRIARYLRATQGAHGGWPLFRGGNFDLSASVKAYFALKGGRRFDRRAAYGRAREAILAHGGAGRSNVFTRILLALVGRGAVARSAGDAGRDDAAAALVPVSSRQDLILVAGRDPVSGADGEAAAGKEPARRHDRRAFRRAARNGARIGSSRRPRR
jgi:hypothetical protein